MKAHRISRNNLCAVSLLLFGFLLQQVKTAVLEGSADSGGSIPSMLPRSPAVIIYEEEEMTNAENKSDGPPILQVLLNDGPSGSSAVDDIIDPPTDILPDDITRRRKRKVQGDTWPNGLVYYEFGQSPPYSYSHKNQIKEAMRWWSDATCLRFQENNTAEVRLYFNNTDKCSSFVGYQPIVKKTNGGRQELKLKQLSCFGNTGTIAHELGHAVGLIHEQSRPDRDDHIKIHVDKIYGKSLGNYQAFYSARLIEGVRYDQNSIMHYSPQTFAMFLNKPTMTAKNSNKDVLMGQRSALGYYDIMAVNKEYCQGNCVDNCLNEGYIVFKNGRCRCVCPEGLTGSRCERTDSSCGGEIRLSANEERAIHTPNYPGNYANKKCIWLITAPADYLVEINFEELEVTRLNGMCPHSVEIRNNVLGQRGDIICGNGAVGSFDTRLDYQNHQMMVVFDSTNRTVATGKGFRAKVNAFRDGCLSNPCENGGTCLSTGSMSYKCLCHPGYIGSTCGKANDAAVNCDFAENLCMFTNADDDDLDMRRMFISTKFLEPVKRDHNSNRFFMAAPVEHQTPQGSKAILKSPAISGNEIGRRCLKFAYHMGGKHQNNSQLRVDVEGVRGSTDNIFVRNGVQGAGWKNAVVDIDSSGDYEVKFVIRTNTLVHYNSLIAIDDIEIQPHRCSGGPCANNPCGDNGGTCVEPNRGGYYCLCPPGYSGTTCNEYDVDGFTCKFETEELCGWTNTKADNFDWVHQYGAADTRKRTGPISGAGGSGYYMLADTSTSTAGVGKKSQLVSPQLKTNGAVCVEFSYLMFGPDVRMLELKTLTRHRYSQAFHSLSGNQSANVRDWRTARVTVQTSTDSQLVFEATSGQRHLSDIAVDSIKVNRGACHGATIATQRSARRTTRTPRQRLSFLPTRSARTSRLKNKIRMSRQSPTNVKPQRRVGQPGANLASCNFERKDCADFINTPSSTRHKQWIRHEGATPSMDTGPQSAYQGHYYLYSEADYLTAGESNILSTHLLYNRGGKACVSFHYSMHGIGMGSLELMIKPENGDERRIWSKQGNQGASWREAGIDVDMENQFYQFMFKATRGNDYRSDIAIDDIQIRRSTCRNSASVPSSARSSQTRIDISCDFERNHICSPELRQSRDDSFDWEISSGGTPSAGTGPDRAAGGTKYLVIEASGRDPGANARLETAIVPARSGIVCLKLNYHMKGMGVGTFKVYRKRAHDRLLIFSKSGDQGNDWKSLQQTLPDDNQPYKLELEANVGTSHMRYRSDIAIDNFSTVSGAC